MKKIVSINKLQVFFTFFTIVGVVVIFSPIINFDKDIHFSCASINEDSKVVIKCFAEPNDAWFINERIEVRLIERLKYLSQENYLANVLKVNQVISYYNGIAYRPIYCELVDDPLDEEGIVFDGIVKIKRISIFKLMLASMSNWLEPYSGEKIIINKDWLSQK